MSCGSGKAKTGGCCGCSCGGGSAEKVKDTAAYDLKSKAKVAQKAPYKVAVEKGKTYYLCSCGYSKNQVPEASHAACRRNRTQIALGFSR